MGGGGVVLVRSLQTVMGGRYLVMSLQLGDGGGFSQVTSDSYCWGGAGHFKQLGGGGSFGQVISIMGVRVIRSLQKIIGGRGVGIVLVKSFQTSGGG